MRKMIVALVMGVWFMGGTTAWAVLIDPYDNVLAPDGHYGLFYFNYYSADEFTDSSGDKAVDADLTARVGVLRPVSYFHVGKLPMVFNLIIPFGEVKEDEIFNESSSGLGDIILSPAVFLLADEDTGTYLSYWFYLTTPTGEWDKDQNINLGGHHWAFQHQLAFEKITGPVVLDANLNYYHHSEERDNDVQLPPRFEVEASLAYQLTDALILGVNGGGYWDLDEVEVDGVAIADTDAKRIQFGPTAAYQLNEKVGVNLRWTHDFTSENDAKGEDVWFRLSYVF